ncbi:hypothetical protein KR093_008458 [Drosophila rubida]|uniref:GH16 domain-containing protein n=1 Tax=Drosophila rubida TaxID=30044 RepID=A0AAD4K1S3_9MUSC|nr:hypothetical protein KR093_008458 [Drosophila rubida]
MPGECSGKLIFEENFNDPKLANWRHAIYASYRSSLIEFTVYVKDRIFVKDGHMHIEATMSNSKTRFKLPDCNVVDKKNKHKCGPYRFSPSAPTPPFYSAKIQSTMNTLKYGRYEIRAKMPKGNYLFPYIMLLPKGTQIDGVGETNIRIAYARGNTKLSDIAFNDLAGSTVFGGAMFYYNNGMYVEVKSSQPHKTPGAHFGDSFHNYTMIWHKDRIIFKVDGVTYGTITDKVTLKHLDQHESYYFVLGLTVGGIHNFPSYQVNFDKVGGPIKLDAGNAANLIKEHVQSNPWTHPKLVIDYVRVYETYQNEN